MAFLTRDSLLNLYNKELKSKNYQFNESQERSLSEKALLRVSDNFSFSDEYDIFLSHSYDDARVVRQVKEMLEKKGYKVYVDWIEDDHLERGNVTAYTALVLKNRMQSCKSLIYLTSVSAKNSVWMPWELGYMDANTGNVSILPVLEKNESFVGREYLGIYPYIKVIGDIIYIHTNEKEWVGLGNWLKGIKK